MSEQRVLVIESPAQLRIDTGRLKIERDGLGPVFILPKDIAVLCLEHPIATLSVAVLRALAEALAMVMVTDACHLPCALQLPLAAPGQDAGRLRQQMVLDASEKREQLWQQLVMAKLATQAQALRRLQRKGALRLERLTTQVLPGDKSHAEAQGAKHYWNHLLPINFQRSKAGAQDPINMRLNYGYAVLRAMIARALVAAGLNGALGLGHCNAGNAFNLADDFIEPYRFLVDVLVVEEVDSWQVAPPFDSVAKRRLLGFVEQPVRIDGQDRRLHAAIELSVASFVRILEGKGQQLVLPEGWSVAGEKWVLTDGA